MERFYGGCLCYGPPIENGFYYDMFLDGQKWACIITSSVFRHDSSLKISLYTSVVIMERLLFKSVIDGFGLSECSQQFFPSPCQSEENWWWALVMNRVCFLFPGECPALSLGTWRLCVSLWWRKNSRLRGLRSARRHCWRCLRWERTLTSSNFYSVHALNLAINTGKMFNQVKNHNNQKCFCLSVQQIQVPYSEWESHHPHDYSLQVRKRKC